MAHRSYKDASKNVNWGRDENESLSIEQINCGSIQRIADACELMAKDRAAMERNNKSLRESKEADARYIRTLERRVAALRGCLKRAKKKGGR